MQSLEKHFLRFEVQGHRTAGHLTPSAFFIFIYVYKFLKRGEKLFLILLYSSFMPVSLSACVRITIVETKTEDRRKFVLVLKSSYFQNQEFTRLQTFSLQSFRLKNAKYQKKISSIFCVCLLITISTISREWRSQKVHSGVESFVFIKQRIDSILSFLDSK